jgi:hypothetical protein
MPMKLGKKMVEAKTVVTIAVYMVISFFGVLGRVTGSARYAQYVGLSVVCRSDAGYEILTQPSRSLA